MLKINFCVIRKSLTKLFSDIVALVTLEKLGVGVMKCHESNRLRVCFVPYSIQVNLIKVNPATCIKKIVGKNIQQHFFVFS